MSEHIIKIIPTDPKFVPNEKKTSLDLLNNKLNNIEIEIKELPEIEFIDQGSYFEKLICNVCNKEILIEKWNELMNKAFDNKFKNLEIITLCCV
jgi:hypothetical protein